jgi:mRNA-degrading endonuclease RelE of RelBE toxin-antitoxin system
MNFEVKATRAFEKDIKRLAKKYPSLKSEFIHLVNELKQTPQMGTAVGNNCYKIRISIASKGKGKSGGARVITYVQITNSTVFLLAIYDKSENEKITDKELNSLLKHISD